MIAENFYKRPLIIGIGVAAIVHSAAILIRELHPIPLLAPLINTIAFNGSWVYFISIVTFIIINIKKVKEFFVCIPQRVSVKTAEGLRLILGYEFTALFILLIFFPAITYFYSEVQMYFGEQYPQIHRFLNYMPFTDLINRAMTSFPFFITLFSLVSLLCVTIPHTYLSYKYAKKAASPLHSAITFSILLSIGITAIILGLIATSISFWMILVLALVGPVILFSYIIINIMMLRYHNKFIECDDDSNKIPSI